MLENTGEAESKSGKRTPRMTDASKSELSPMNATRLQFIFLAAALASFACAAPSLRAQDTNQGPIAPPPKFEMHRMPSVPHPGPPPIPVPQIIQKFAANEDTAKEAYDEYSFTQTIRIEELSDPGGKITITGESYVKGDGRRYWRMSKPIQSSLKLTSYSLEDVRPVLNLPLFFLTSDQIANYDFVYAGQQKLDELNTYIFQVKPKGLKRGQRFFDGIVYVDDHDLAIVETYGKFVSEVAGKATDLPFSMFETYCENFQNKYWLPTYTSSDDYTGSGDSELHLRLVIRDSDFKQNTAESGQAAAPQAAPAASNTPASQK